MSTEFDYDLTPQQWEALKAMRLTALAPVRVNRSVLNELIALQLAGMNGDGAFITPTGRKVLIRGSARLLDLAA